MQDGIILKEGIPFNGDDFLLFSSVKLKESIAFYLTNNCDKAIFNFHSATPFEEANLDVLNEIPVKELIVFPYHIGDISAINQQHELESLTIHTDPSLQSIDFNNFPKLKTFKGCWTKELKNLFDRISLEELCLWKYNPSPKDLSALRQLKKLHSLDIIQGNIETLSGIERLPRLKKLAISHNRNLVTFGSFPAGDNHLEELSIEVCKKININQIKGLNKLTSLSLLNNGKYLTFKSLFDNLPSLEYFNFNETDLIEGDMNYFLQHKFLKRVSFLERRHYKYTCDGLNKALEAKVVSNI